MLSLKNAKCEIGGDPSTGGDSLKCLVGVMKG